MNRKDIYITIKDKLKTIVDDNKEMLFKHFDLWNNSVNFLAGETPFDYPACFIEFIPVQWNTFGGNAQKAKLTFRIHILTKWYSQTHDSSPVSDNQLDYLNIPDAVFKALQGVYVLENSSAIIRTDSVINHSHLTIVDSIEIYSCELWDTSAVEAPEQLNLSVEISTP